MSKLISNLKVLIVHRDYRTEGGEEVFLKEILTPALKTSSIDFEILRLPSLSLRDPNEVFTMLLGLERLRPSYSLVLKKIESGHFTHVLFNNFIPTVSLALPRALKSLGIKTMCWIHNGRLDCANGLHFNGKEKCKKCLYKGSRWAFIQNCQRNLFQSVLYALTYRFKRVARLVTPFIDLFICNSEYTRKNIEETFRVLGMTGSSCVISMPTTSKPESLNERSENLTLIKKIVEKIPRPFYLFLGRLNYDKGADIFLNLARKYPHRGFLMCGTGPLLNKLKKEPLPNLAFGGHVGEEKSWLFKNCEALIVPSRWPETSSLVISESHGFGTPIVYPRGGGAEETFKLLGRTGCSLDEFTAQTFNKELSVGKSFSLKDFSYSLSSKLQELK